MNIIFGTPYNNEFPSDNEGRIFYLNRSLLPIEKSFIELVKYSNSNDEYPIPGKIYNCKEFSWMWKRCGGHFISENRNSIISGQSLDKPVPIGIEPVEWPDAFIFVDSDISFNIKNILSLINAKLPIISGAYMLRTDNRCITAGKLNEYDSVKTAISKNAKGLKKCDYLGAGALYVERSVLVNIGFPWFDQYHDIINGMHTLISDDISFCLRSKNAGYKLIVDCDNVFTHNILQGVNCMTKLDKIKTELCDLYIAQKNHDFAMQRLIQKIREKEMELNEEVKNSSKIGEVSNDEKKAVDE